MVPALCADTATVPPPSYQRARRPQPAALHVTALTRVTTRRLLALCRPAVRLAHRRCPPPLPKGPGGRPRTDREESLPLIAPRRTLWRWPAACLATPPANSRSPAPASSASAPPFERLFLVTVQEALHRGLTRARDLILDSAPLLARRRRDPAAASGHAPAHHPTPWLRGCRAHTLLCRGSGLPLFFVVAPPNRHDAPFARLRRAWAVRRYDLRPRYGRPDAAYWGLALIPWVHAARGAVAVAPRNPQRRKNRAGLPPTWTAPELGQRGGSERFFGRVCRCFGLQRPPVVGWTAVVQRVALTYTATVVVALVAHQAGRPDLIPAPKRVLAHLWEGGR